jgi:hypothetical protein
LDLAISGFQEVGFEDLAIAGLGGTACKRPRSRNSLNPQIARFQIPQILKSTNQINPEILKS